ncbi:P-type ATPase [Streptomyces albogriseolus]|uniref:P-type ATPase n=1 Tax=Streptomyces albogriseolus TaxID=1887 RepID=UPI0036FB32E2
MFENRLSCGRRPVPTPLHCRLAWFGRVLAAGVVGLCVLVMAFGLVRGRPVEPMIVAAFSLVVAAVLESLPAVVPLALDLGARWMADRHATVRLSACPPAACGGGAGLGHGDRHRQDRHFDRGRRGCRVAVGTGRVHPQYARAEAGRRPSRRDAGYTTPCAGSCSTGSPAAWPRSW